MINDPIIQKALEAIKNIEEFCDRAIKPWEPNAAYRATCLFRELARPYLETISDHMSTRPKSSFQIPVFKYYGKLYPITDVPD